MKQIEMSEILETQNADLLQLIKRGESLEVEFKQDSRDFSDSHVYEAVVAMTNTAGGIIFVGVADDGNVTGCQRISNGTWKTIESVAGMIMANTLPACATSISIQKIKDQKVLVIRVPKSITTTGTKSGKFLKRQLDTKGKPQNVPMTADDIVSGVTRIGIQDFSGIILSDANIEDLNLDLVTTVSRRRSTEVAEPYRKDLFLKPPREILKAIGLLSISDGKPNIAALLLFGRSEKLKEKLPNHEIQYQVFGARGELLRNNAFVGPIAEVFPRLLELPETLQNSDEFRNRGANFVIPEYPEDSRREAIANSIVHRDYTLQPSIQIQLYEKELIITNPGSFPAGVNLSNLLNVSPNPRNRRLAEAMREFGFVESSGRGIDFIFQGQVEYGRPAPDYSGSDAFKVSVRLTGGKANLDFCRFIISSVKNPSIPELLILNALFFRRDLTLEQMANIIQRPTSVTQEILGKLKEDKLIEATSDKQQRYLLKGSANHNAMKAVKPLRMTNAQLEQFKISILEELQRESPNSVSSIADRVGLSPSQARRLLNSLKSQKKVKIHKSKKWEPSK